MIDRSLNYGRHHIEAFLRASMPYTTVVDIGAGSGADLLLARKVNPGAKLYAIEAASEQAARLREQGIEVFPIDVERTPLPFGCAAIDIVIANQILEHTKEIFWIAHEVTRILRLGGKFLIGLPNLASLHNRVLLALGRQPSPIQTASAHVRGFTRTDILRFFEACFPAGYSVRAWGGSNFYPFPPVLARPLARMLPSMAWGLFLHMEKQRDYHREFLDFVRRERLESNFYLGPTR